ncbi:MAG: dimethylargininase [Acidobacteria bacterium RBG_13_68_16]|nr:MAG: dimethylargininase [Acidobacteria bacterium RBG_13_68_16]
MPTAITRKVSPAITRCELTHLQRQAIDVALATRQHEAYERCLAGLGCRVVSLPAASELPDSVFIEDTAVVLDQLAVVTRPGAASRRAETPSVAQVLAEYRPVAAIRAPGTLDGGDVLRVGRRVFVGLSARSSEDGIEQLRELLSPHGYGVEALPVTGCLHLKSAVTQVASEVVLLNPKWVNPAAFDRYKRIEVDPSEPYAANALLIGDAVLYPTAFPRTAARLDGAGIRLVAVDVSELAKAEGAITCCSLILKD